MSVTTAEEAETISLSELGKKFIGGTVWMSAAQIGSYGLTFGANILLARLLAPDVFGVFALATSIISIFYILGSWSFSVAVIQTEEFDQAFFDTAFALSLGLGIALFILAFIVSFPLRAFYSDQVVRILLILAGLQVPKLLSSCYGAALKRELEYRGVSLVQMAARAMSLFVAVVLAWRGFGVWSLVGKEAIRTISAAIGMRSITPWRFNRGFDTESAKNLLKFGSGMLGSSGLASFLSSFPSLIAGTILGTTLLGYFDRAFKLSKLGHTTAGTGVNQVSLAAYSRLQASRKKLVRGFEVVNYFLLRAIVPLSALFLLFGKDAVISLYGEKWRMTGTLLQLLSPSVLIMTAFDNAKKLLVSQANVGIVVKIRIAQSAVLLVGMPILLDQCGVLGAALAIDVMYLVGLVMAYMYARQKVKLSLGRLWIPPVVSSIFAAFCFLGFRGWLLQVGKAKGLIGVGVLPSLVCYIGGLWLLEKQRVRRNLSYLIGVILER
jgi:PST family polysaccharide transporter